MLIDFKKIVWFNDTGARRAFIAAHPDGALVSPEMPLRSNLTVLENIAVVPQYRRNLSYSKAVHEAYTLLDRAEFKTCALKRDADLDSEERFVAKWLRAVIASPPLILIDRPGFLLPDTDYPQFLEKMVMVFKPTINDFRILEYPWNRPLYPHP